MPLVTANPVEDTSSQPLWFIDNLAYVLIDGAQTGNAYGLIELTGRRGDMPPLHVHHRDDETFYVLEGDVDVFVGDRRETVNQGRALLAPRGIAHSYRVGSEQARWLVINNPAWFEQFVRAVGEPAPTPELPPLGRALDPAALAQTAADYGIETPGPRGPFPEVSSRDHTRVTSV